MVNVVSYSKVTIKIFAVFRAIREIDISCLQDTNWLISSFSPENIALLKYKWWVSINLISADIFYPGPIIKISPGTIFYALTVWITPFLRMFEKLGKIYWNVLMIY